MKGSTDRPTYDAGQRAPARVMKPRRKMIYTRRVLMRAQKTASAVINVENNALCRPTNNRRWELVNLSFYFCLVSIR
jgi:hypothetical protein